MSVVTLLKSTILLAAMLRTSVATQNSSAQVLPTEDSIFANLGEFVPETAPAHVMGTMDWATEDAHFNQVKRFLKELRGNSSESMPWELDLAVTEAEWKETEHLLFGTRNKRQVVIATVTTVAAAVSATLWLTHQLGALDARLKAVEKGKSARVSTIRALQTDSANAIRALNNIRSITGKTLKFTHQSFWRSSVSVVTEAYFAAVRQRAQWVREALKGSWPSNFLPPRVMEASLLKLARRLRYENRELVDNSMQQLLGAPTLLAVHGRQVRFVALVPTRPKDESWTLLRLVNAPRMVDGVTRTLDLETDLVAVNKERDAAMVIPRTGLSVCKKERGRILCPDSFPVVTGEAVNCLHALATNQHTTSCSMRPWAGDVWMRAVNQGTFLTYLSHSTTMTLTCSDQEETTFLHSDGRALVRLKPGCTVAGPNFRLRAPEDPLPEEVVEVVTSKLPHLPQQPRTEEMPPPIRTNGTGTMYVEETLEEDATRSTPMWITVLFIITTASAMAAIGWWLRKLWLIYKAARGGMKNILSSMDSFRMLQVDVYCELSDLRERLEEAKIWKPQVPGHLPEQRRQETLNYLDDRLRGLIRRVEHRQRQQEEEPEPPRVFESELKVPHSKRRKLNLPKPSSWRPQAASTPRGKSAAELNPAPVLALLPNPGTATAMSAASPVKNEKRTDGSGQKSLGDERCFGANVTGTPSGERLPRSSGSETLSANYESASSRPGSTGAETRSASVVRFSPRKTESGTEPSEADPLRAVLLAAQRP